MHQSLTLDNSSLYLCSFYFDWGRGIYQISHCLKKETALYKLRIQVIKEWMQNGSISF